MTGPPTVLVNSASASQGRPWELSTRYKQPLYRTHSDLVKFSRQDHDYQVVLEFLKEACNSAERVIRMRFPELLSSPEPEALKDEGRKYVTQRIPDRYIHKHSLLSLLKALFPLDFTFEVSIAFMLNCLVVNDRFQEMDEYYKLEIPRKLTQVRPQSFESNSTLR